VRGNERTGSGVSGEGRDTDMQAGGEQIVTSSRLHAWWLVTFKRYRIRAKTMTPHPAVLKRVRYVTTWFLESAN
jgi:hypothetical protein